MNTAWPIVNAVYVFSIITILIINRNRIGLLEMELGGGSGRKAAWRSLAAASEGRSFWGFTVNLISMAASFSPATKWPVLLQTSAPPTFHLNKWASAYLGPCSTP